MADSVTRDCTQGESRDLKAAIYSSDDPKVSDDGEVINKVAIPLCDCQFTVGSSQGLKALTDPTTLWFFAMGVVGMTLLIVLLWQLLGPLEVTWLVASSIALCLAVGCLCYAFLSLQRYTFSPPSSQRPNSKRSSLSFFLSFSLSLSQSQSQGRHSIDCIGCSSSVSTYSSSSWTSSFTSFVLWRSKGVSTTPWRTASRLTREMKKNYSKCGDVRILGIGLLEVKSATLCLGSWCLCTSLPSFSLPITWNNTRWFASSLCSLYHTHSHTTHTPTHFHASSPLSPFLSLVPNTLLYCAFS